MPRESPKINHIDFVDDMLIFGKVEIGIMQLVMGVLEKYEKVSGKKVKECNIFA